MVFSEYPADGSQMIISKGGGPVKGWVRGSGLPNAYFTNYLANKVTSLQFH
jgi:hypothetical protein